MNYYTFGPFGATLEEGGTLTNPFMFTGQFFDSEISQYYLRARQYDPQLMRFTGRDPVRGKFSNPMSLHKYLYCGNDSINKVDLNGQIALVLGGSFSGNLTASDFGSLFNDTKGLGGIGALVAYNSAILPIMTMMSDRFGAGESIGAGFVAAWDHTKNFNDRSAWSWGTMQWRSSGASLSSSGFGVGITFDVGISNARNVGQLAGHYIEGGSSGGPFLNGVTFSGTLSMGLNSDYSPNGIWLLTGGAGAATPGVEGHLHLGDAWVQEYGGF